MGHSIKLSNQEIISMIHYLQRGERAENTFFGAPCKIVKPRNHIHDPSFAKVREGGEYNLSAFSVGELISPANLELIGANRPHFKII